VDEFDTDLWLVCRVRARPCALPLDRVVETMRPLPIEPVAGSPTFVQGLSVIRGSPLPVIDTARLLGHPTEDAERFVIVRVDGRQVALAVGGVLGIRTVPRGSLHALPPLLCGTDAQAVAAVGLLDAELLLVLRSARLLPDNLPEDVPAIEEQP
jgi:purine-binding chemotaxis protein CheW